MRERITDLHGETEKSDLPNVAEIQDTNLRNAWGSFAAAVRQHLVDAGVLAGADVILLKVTLLPPMPFCTINPGVLAADVGEPICVVVKAGFSVTGVDEAGV